MTYTPLEQKSEYIAQSRIKDEFGLTARQVRSLGEPDATRRNPYYRSSPPVKLYLRQRVEQWIAEHQSEIAASQPRRQAANKAVHTKRESAKKEIAKLVGSLALAPIVSRARVQKEAAAFFLERYEDFSGEVTEKGLCSLLRHNYTNYEQILSAVKGKVGATELYQNVKVYLCCRIIAHYGLHVSPLRAAFGDEDGCQDRLERFKLAAGEDLQAAVARMLGIEDPA
jgi:hypothetical protein